MSGVGYPSCRPVDQYNYIKLVEKYETANWSLRQGDEEVNKRIKQKNIYLIKLPNILVWKQPFFRG